MFRGNGNGGEYIDSQTKEMFSLSIAELLKAYHRVDIPLIEGFTETIKRKANLDVF